MTETVKYIASDGWKGYIEYCCRKIWLYYDTVDNVAWKIQCIYVTSVPLYAYLGYDSESRFVGCRVNNLILNGFASSFAKLPTKTFVICIKVDACWKLWIPVSAPCWISGPFYSNKSLVRPKLVNIPASADTHRVVVVVIMFSLVRDPAAPPRSSR